MLKNKIYILIAIIIFIPLVTASFIVGNNSYIDNTYSPNENLKGKINLSLSNENINSTITGTSSGSITLKQFLEINDMDAGSDFTCNPSNCESGYASSSPATTKNFNLKYNQEKILGFVLTGQVNEITSFNFNFRATNPQDCGNPLKIDLFSNGDYEWQSRKVGNSYTCLYETGRGCFETGFNLTSIGTMPYCGKLKLLPSTKFILGAWVQEGAGISDTLSMHLYDLNGEELTSCALPNPNPAGAEVYCNISYNNENLQDYYVCIKADNEDSTKYYTRIESPESNPCGFYGDPSLDIPDEKHDYYIFARAAKFESIGNINFNQQEYENNGNTDLLEDMNLYIQENYNKNCSPECIIPIRFKAYSNVNITVNNLSMGYSKGSGPATENNFYDTSTGIATLSSGFLLLDLSKSNLNVPNSNGNFSFSIYLNNNEMIKENISVGNAPVIRSILPSSTTVAMKTRFSVNAYSPRNRTLSYKWYFENSSQETATTSVSYYDYSYSSAGDHELKVEVIDSAGLRTSRNFLISSFASREIVNSTILKYKLRMDNLTRIINLLPNDYKNIIKNITNFDNVLSELTRLEQKLATSTTQQEYSGLLGNLSQLKIPYKIEENSGTSDFFVLPDNINLENLKELGAGDYENEDKFKLGVAGWSQNNLDMTLEYTSIVGYYDTGVETLAILYKLKIENIGDYSSNLYLFIDNENVIIDYNSQDINDGKGISFSEIPEEINFVISENILPKELKLYLSPKFSFIDIDEVGPCNYDGICDSGETSKNCRNDCKPWLAAWVMWIILLVLAIIAYIFLQWWYTVKYETHLFKNRNDVFNLMNSIKNARQMGIADRETFSRLKSAGWSREKISYVVKKIEGRAIMPFSFIRFFRKKENRYPIPKEVNKSL